MVIAWIYCPVVTVVKFLYVLQDIIVEHYGTITTSWSYLDHGTVVSD